MSVLWVKIKDILELVVFKHSIFALPFLLSAMIVASKLKNDSVWFGFSALILGIICAVSARNFAMATNRLMDEDIDKDNPRCKDRPNISGRIGKMSVWGFILVNALVFIVCSYFINPLAFYLSFPVLFLLAFYSAFKRFSSLAHLVLGFCLGLAPVAGSIIVLGEIHLFSVILCLGVTFWTAGFDLLYSLQDMEYDKKVGLHSVPAKFGASATLFISAFCHFLATLFWLLFVWVAPLGGLAFFGVLICGAILMAEHLIVRKNFAHIDRAFFTLNGYLSVVFFIFVLVDLLWR
ncbi:menaquinone biosynthesis prenyltransferase MqnP [Campylobacter upsaliensis]|uniref:4-hydroxybenzoate polyprenyltransferase n=1 Tax=Campylobacter upsaliensis JV21 TaxID=888826 RepID=A0A828R1F2_CAMUP|nr:menaquinone biosynthesis prenyltransferase MqnP [Campylobacter upsaliensis]EAH5199051.1 4-hydroxybenzoate polyprenyltransferase [Campylobacter upsaliensis]EAH5546036.1 4-hydroxybenzoate polyprenyltransferase [Campylobacter upsaliensis]EAH5977121.1 4-hydroxybenzoate polyprenyltransferase [Campylobacter upsaliensis]EAH6228071.1 4-hydroxybenzoate polyprenyltransferase [Campylobacter upsaliensis]EAH7701052.1 4-hydroxybenzoate polyprenyltransferase [Campylobacter upsaliensis]